MALTFGLSSKLQPQAIYMGYVYNKYRENLNGSVIYRCVNYVKSNCHTYIVTKTNEVINNPPVHTHKALMLHSPAPKFNKTEFAEKTAELRIIPEIKDEKQPSDTDEENDRVKRLSITSETKLVGNRSPLHAHGILHFAKQAKPLGNAVNGKPADKMSQFSGNCFIDKISNNETENIMPSSNVYSTTTSSAEEDDDELLDRVYAALNKRVKTSVSKVPSKQHCGDTSKSLLVSVCKNISTSHNSSAKIKRKNLLSSPPKRLTSKKMRSSTKAIKKWIKY